MLKEIALNRVCLAAYSKRLPMQRWAIPDNQRSPSVRVSVWMDHDKKTFHGDWYVSLGFHNEIDLTQITKYITSIEYYILYSHHIISGIRIDINRHAIVKILKCAIVK